MHDNDELEWGDRVIRVDDGFPQHPKVLPLKLEALGWWLVLTCHSKAHSTGGFIDEETLPLLRVGVSADLVAECTARLVARGLLERVENGWVLHDFADWQGPEAKFHMDERRRKNAERQKRFRDAHRDDPDDGVTRNASSNGVTGNAPRVHESNTPDPYRSVPIRSVPEQRAPAPAPARVSKDHSTDEHRLSTLGLAAPAETLSAEIADILAELQKHRCLREPASPGAPGIDLHALAESIEGVRFHQGRLLPWVLDAIVEAVGDITRRLAGGEHIGTAERSAIVGRYCQNARAPKTLQNAPLPPPRPGNHGFHGAPSNRRTAEEQAAFDAGVKRDLAAQDAHRLTLPKAPPSRRDPGATMGIPGPAIKFESRQPGDPVPLALAAPYASAAMAATRDAQLPKRRVVAKPEDDQTPDLHATRSDDPAPAANGGAA